jgi:hypothetical protein
MCSAWNCPNEQRFDPRFRETDSVHAWTDPLRDPDRLLIAICKNSQAAVSENASPGSYM